ncbi:hypothetical protein Btru_068216 [Bulinus truncatus]|nr:hypothetical protein Btru_068216 [Bulinus truncatus]
MSLQMSPCYKDTPESRHCNVLKSSAVKFTCSVIDIFDIRLEWRYISDIQNTYISVDMNSSKVVSMATPYPPFPGQYNHTSTLTIWSDLLLGHTNMYCLSMLQDEVKTKSALFIGFRFQPVVPSSVVQSSQFTIECGHNSLRLPHNVSVIHELRLEKFLGGGQVEVIAVNTPNTSTCSLRHPRFLNSLVKFIPDGQLFSSGSCVPAQNATRENMIIRIDVQGPAARCSDSGAYRCSFQSAEGKTYYSPPSRLTVVARPTIQAFKKSKCSIFQTPPCKSVTLSCLVFGPKETVIKFVSPSVTGDGSHTVFKNTKASKELMAEHFGNCERYRHQASTSLQWPTNLSIPACNAFIDNYLYATMKSELARTQTCFFFGRYPRGGSRQAPTVFRKPIVTIDVEQDPSHGINAMNMKIGCDSQVNGHFHTNVLDVTPEKNEIQMIDKPVVATGDPFTIYCEGAWFDVPPAHVLKMSVTALTETRATIASYLSTAHPPLSKLHDRFIDWSVTVVQNVYEPNIVLKINGPDAQCSDSGWYECEIVDKSNVSYVQTAHVLVNETHQNINLNVYNCISDTFCTLQEGDELNVFCSVNALFGARLNWIYNNSDQFSHTLNVSHVSSEPSGPRDYCDQYLQTSKLHVKYARQHMTGWLECQVVMAGEILASARVNIRIRASGNKILDKTHFSTVGSFQMVCSTDMFHVPPRDLDHMKVSVLTKGENVVVNYSLHREPPLAFVNK